jgi:hypothetical protein
VIGCLDGAVVSDLEVGRLVDFPSLFEFALAADPLSLARMLNIACNCSDDSMLRAELYQNGAFKVGATVLEKCIGNAAPEKIELVIEMHAVRLLGIFLTADLKYGGPCGLSDGDLEACLGLWLRELYPEPRWHSYALLTSFLRKYLLRARGGLARIVRGRESESDMSLWGAIARSVLIEGEADRSHALFLLADGLAEIEPGATAGQLLGAIDLGAIFTGVREGGAVTDAIVALVGAWINVAEDVPAGLAPGELADFAREICSEAHFETKEGMLETLKVVFEKAPIAFLVEVATPELMSAIAEAASGGAREMVRPSMGVMTAYLRREGVRSYEADAVVMEWAEHFVAPDLSVCSEFRAEAEMLCETLL